MEKFFPLFIVFLFIFFMGEEIIGDSNTSYHLAYIDKHINEYSFKYGLDPELVRAVIKVESNYNPKAVSPKGAIGLMQLLPSTAKLMGVKDPYNIEENIYGGCKYLKILMEEFSGDLKLALAAYNAGKERVIQYKGIPPYKETIDYVKKVLTIYNGTGYSSRQVKVLRGENGRILITNMKKLR